MALTFAPLGSAEIAAVISGGISVFGASSQHRHEREEAMRSRMIDAVFGPASDTVGAAWMMIHAGTQRQTAPATG